MFLELKDYQITINGFVSRCHCKCKHCLLCSGDEKISFYSGYLNLNGTRIRKGAELKEWVGYLKACGVRNANLSWFGEEEFHGEFANRKGYFEYLIDLANELKSAGITWNNTVFLLKSSIGQLEQLTDRLKGFGENIHYSFLDYRGNGKNMLNEFLNEEDKVMLPEFIFNTNLFNRNKPEYEWIRTIKKKEHPKLEKRMLFLVATPDNVDNYLQMTVDDILEMFHEIDYRLQSSIPSIQFLADTYGNKVNTMLFDFRSILWKWMNMYFDENPQLDKTLLFSDIHTGVMWR